MESIADNFNFLHALVHLEVLTEKVFTTQLHQIILNFASGNLNSLKYLVRETGNALLCIDELVMKNKYLQISLLIFEFTAT